MIRSSELSVLRSRTSRMWVMGIWILKMRKKPVRRVFLAYTDRTDPAKPL